MYLIFEYYSNNTLFVFVFGHNSEPEYYSYSYSAKYLCTNIIRIRIRSFWENEYYSYSYSVKILIPNIIRIRIRSKKQYSLTYAWKNEIESHFSTAKYHPSIISTAKYVTSINYHFNKLQVVLQKPSLRPVSREARKEEEEVMTMI